MPTNRLLPQKRYAISKRDTKDVASTFEVISSQTGLSQSNKPERSIQKFLDSYAEFVWVYSAIYTISNAAAGIPILLFQEDEEGNLTELNEHPLLTVLNHPNKVYTKHDLIEILFTQLESTGNAFWECVRDKFGTVVSIFPLNPKRMEIIPDAQKYIKEYIFEINGRRIKFDPQNIIHFKYPNPDNDYWGLSPLSAASNSLVQEDNAITWNKKFFKNSARPDVVFSVNGPLNKKSFARMKVMLKKMFGGVDNAHSAAILENGIDVKQLGFAPKDLEFLNLRRFDREEILSVFGVPPALIGIFDSAIRANAAEQRKFFWQTTMISKLDKIEMIINEMFVPQFEKFSTGKGKLVLKFDLSSVDALSEGTNDKSGRLVNQVGAGIITPNEARLELGYETLPGLDTIRISLNPFATLGQPVSGTDPNATQDIIVDVAPHGIISKEKGDVIWKRVDNIRESFSKDFKKEMKDYFEELAKDVDDKLSTLEKYYKKKLIAKQINVETVFPEKTNKNKVKKIVEDNLKMTVRTSGNLAIIEISADIGIAGTEGFNETASIIRDFIVGRALEASTSVTDTTKKRINNILADAYERGLSIPDLRNLLTDELSGIGIDSRIATIVNTEVGIGLNSGRRFAVDQLMEQVPTANIKKVWISARDGKVRASHQVNDTESNAHPLSIDATYPNGLKYPQDPSGDAGEVINCRCVESFVSGSLLKRVSNGLISMKKVRLTNGMKLVTKRYHMSLEEKTQRKVFRIVSELMFSPNGKH